MIASKNFAIRSFVLALALVYVGQTVADDQKPPQSSAAPADQRETVHLLLHPADLPYAALKYQLLPKGIEKTPGNAAPHYFRAALMMASDKAIQDADAQSSPGASSQLDEWLNLPVDELSKNEAAQKFFNERPTGFWDLINLAAHREQCDWDLPIREFNMSTLIPELIKLRDMARLLAFKARVEISRGQFDNALETLKTGFAVARHAAAAPTLVNAMVGAKITDLMLEQVRILIQQPKSPNLYWALTTLPNPIVDLSTGVEFEGGFVYLFLPELRGIRTAVHTEAEWDKMLFQVADKLIKVLPGIGNQKQDLSWYGIGALFAVTAYPKAKQQLQEAGYSPSQIKEMPVSQAILTAEVEMFDRLNNDTFKWFYVDSASALKGMAEADRDLQEFGKSKREIIPLASILLPSLRKVKSVEVETDRYVAALRCVEAIRLYAARHHAQLPRQLSDINEVPIPNDPVTGQPFSYQSIESRALITSPALPGETAIQEIRWEIQLALGKP
ncbi:MAG TPA: hypothetical protein VMJ32_10480 [Pirellulales bacterium]|nr:hypothetical protein [Pirellulales bacterium]